jgi:hypothetical protein
MLGWAGNIYCTNKNPFNFFPWPLAGVGWTPFWCHLRRLGWKSWLAGNFFGGVPAAKQSSDPNNVLFVVNSTKAMPSKKKTKKTNAIKINLAWHQASGWPLNGGVPPQTRGDISAAYGITVRPKQAHFGGISIGHLVPSTV